METNTLLCLSFWKNQKAKKKKCTIARNLPSRVLKGRENMNIIRRICYMAHAYCHIERSWQSCFFSSFFFFFFLSFCPSLRSDAAATLPVVPFFVEGHFLCLIGWFSLIVFSPSRNVFSSHLDEARRFVFFIVAWEENEWWWW